MPRSASLPATSSINRCRMPAPAPCPSTSNEIALLGFSKSAETPPAFSFTKNWTSLPWEIPILICLQPPKGHWFVWVAQSNSRFFAKRPPPSQRHAETIHAPNSASLSLSERIDEAVVDHFANWNFALKPAGLDLLLDGGDDSRVENAPVERE